MGANPNTLEVLQRCNHDEIFFRHEGLGVSGNRVSFLKISKQRVADQSQAITMRNVVGGYG